MPVVSSRERPGCLFSDLFVLLPGRITLSVWTIRVRRQQLKLAHDQYRHKK